MRVNPPQTGAEGIAVPGELPLLGRLRELAELDAALASARSGRGGLLLLTGEPGIGKTRLAAAVGERAEAEGAMVAWARGWDGGGAPAYWPWQQVIRTVSRERPADRLLTELGAGARWVAHVAPELRGRLPAGDLPGAPESEQARFALFDAVTVFLSNAAADTPLVVLLDDLHTADQASLLLLAFLARAIADTQILVVATLHDAGPPPSPEAEAVLGELGRFGRRLALSGLGDAELAELIEHRSGTTPAPELVRALREITEGNPFFSDELVQLLASQGRLTAPLLAGGPLGLPDGVRDAIRRRLQPLAPEAIELLELAAVVGRGFRLGVLQRAAGTDRAALLELLGEALRLQLIMEVPGEAGSFRFAHGLVRETLLSGLPALRRARLHGEVARALERRGDAPGGPGLVELAHHYVEAAPAGDPLKALQYAARAGHDALALLAYERAAELFGAALRALDLLDEPDERRRGELLLARGQAELHAGDGGARATLLAAADVARRLGDPGLLARTALSLGGFGLSPGVVDEQLVGLLGEALDLLGDDDRALRARLLVRKAVALYWSDRASYREELVAQAVALGRAAGDIATLAYVLDQGQMATNGPDSTPRGHDWALELFALSESAGDPELAARARSWHIDVLLELDDLPAADMAIETLDRIATDLRDPRARSYVPLHRARRALMEGRTEDTERLVRAGVERAASLHDSAVPLIAGAQMFALRRSQRRLGELEEATRRFADGLPAMPAWRCALAILYLDTERPEEARREFEHLAAVGFAGLPRDNVWTVSMALLAEVCAALGDAERAETLYGLLAPLSGRNAVSPEGVFSGPVDRYLALLAATRGDWAAAAAHTAAAREACRRLGVRPMLAAVALDEGELLVRRGEPGDAQRAGELLIEARALAAELPMPGIDARADRLEATLEPEEPTAAPAPAPVAAGAPVAATMRRAGELWAIAFDGRDLHVRDAKGVRHLALLLGHPGIEFHALDIVAAGGALPPGSGLDAAAVRADGLEVQRGPDDAGALLDAPAKAAYRSRLEDLRAELEEAEAFHDPERAARAREEMEFLAQELAAAVGLGGRDRRAASNAERARVNVTRAVRSAIRRITTDDALLGRELEATVHTGYFCRYEPDPRRPVTWTVEGG